jgi:hypothetical protein
MRQLLDAAVNLISQLLREKTALPRKKPVGGDATDGLSLT